MKDLTEKTKVLLLQKIDMLIEKNWIKVAYSTIGGIMEQHLFYDSYLWEERITFDEVVQWLRHSYYCNNLVHTPEEFIRLFYKTTLKKEIVILDKL